MNILFDLDGTLTDPREGMVRCIKIALAGLGEPCPPDPELVRFIGPPLKDSFDALFGAGSPKTAEAIALYRQQYSSKGLLENAVYPEIAGALASLAGRGAILVVATSKPTMFAERIIEHFGLGEHFRAIYGSELDGTRSDKAELISHVLKAENLPAMETMMVGDRMHDMIGARANGVFPVGVLWGYGTRQELEQSGAAVLCQAPAELPSLFASHRNA